MSDSKEKEVEKAAEVYSDLSTLNALSDLYPDLASDENITKLAETVTKVTSTVETSKGEDEEEDEDEEEESNTLDNEEEENDEEDSDDSEEEDEEEDEDDVFGLKKKSKTVEVPFSLDEKGKEFLKSRYSISDESKFFASVDKWRKDSQDLATVSDEKEELVEALSSLPEQIKASINAFAEGKDYIEAFGVKNKIDFNKEFDDLDKDDIVSYYFPEKYKSIVSKLDSDDITEDDADERINDLADAAKSLFKKDKKGIEEKRAELIRNEQIKVKKVKESVASSVKNLEKHFPDFKPAEKQRIRQILVDGNPDSIFRNKDGSYKEDAALRLAYALNYEKLTKRSESIAKNKGVTEANIDIVNKSKKKLDKGKAATVTQKQQMAEKAVEHLSSFATKDPYE